jgi:hypothetical protein
MAGSHRYSPLLNFFPLKRSLWDFYSVYRGGYASSKIRRVFRGPRWIATKVCHQGGLPILRQPRNSNCGEYQFTNIRPGKAALPFEETNANSPASIPAPACPLPSWLRLYESVGVPAADVNTRISHLAECQSAALEHAPAAAGAAAGHKCSAKEFLRGEVPEG